MCFVRKLTIYKMGQSFCDIKSKYLQKIFIFNGLLMVLLFILLEVGNRCLITSSVRHLAVLSLLDADDVEMIGTVRLVGIEKR